MQFHTLSTGFFKLDGGAMFGVVPKTIWSKKIPANELNLCAWQMRCLLVEYENRLILVDTGMGNKQPEKWQGYYDRTETLDLAEAIQQAGFSPNEVTDVVLSHLHFDHAGGAVQQVRADPMGKLTCPNAKHWTSRAQWEWAMHPNPREKATFLSENLMPIQSSGLLSFIDDEPHPLGQDVTLLAAHGHTEHMIMPVFTHKGQKIWFAADTIPSHAHIHVPYVMGYDIRPLDTMKEKENWLAQAVQEEWIIVFDHDPFHAAGVLEKTEKGFQAKELGELQNFLIL